jgi:hypothetical protein
MAAYDTVLRELLGGKERRLGNSYRPMVNR